ncbi:MAG: hypothetical protein JRC77_10595 [Deltaproteobacteria bacterium]|nr:hypothetical protein [Deltaproteobacteria bacterium]
MKKFFRSLVLGWIGVAVLVTGALPASAGRRIEAVGAVPIFEDAGQAAQSSARTAAFDKAIWEAVLRVAEELRASDLAAKEARATLEKQSREEEERLRKERERAAAQAKNLDPVPLFGGGSNAAEDGTVVEVGLPDEAETKMAPREILRLALGDQPRGYTNRYRISEDRGLRERLFTGDENPEVSSEYVVVAQVDVDVERIRKALVKAGVIDMVVDANVELGSQLRLVILDPLNYRLVTDLQRVIEEEMEHSSALPLEFERGQAVLAVRSDLGPENFARSLIRRLPAQLHVKQATVRGDEIVMRFEVLLPIEEGAETASPGGR